MTTILFDFDGVLVDSVTEIAISSYNLAAGAKVITPEQLPPGYLELFRNNRHLIMSASRLGLQARWCLEQLKLEKSTDTFISHTGFQVYLDSAGGTTPQMAEKLFAIRSWFMESHPQEWLSANYPFEPIWAATKLFDQDRMAILTAKNSAAVLKICHHFDYPISANQIFSAEAGHSKIDNLRMLDTARPGGNYIFIDDALENLRVVTPTLPGRITPVLAQWGFSSADDKDHALKEGLPVLSQLEFIARYMK